MDEHGLPPDLRAGIEQLYEVFAGYPLEAFGPCPHCYSAKEVARTEQRLRTVPLRELTVRDLRRFYTDGLMTWGDVDDLRHLCPRLLELFATYWLTDQLDGLPFAIRSDLDPYRALMRFTDAGWTTWPDRERSAIDRYLLGLWRGWLGASDLTPLPRGGTPDTDLLGAILLVVPDARPYLAQWLDVGAPALRDLAWFIRYEQVEGPFWELGRDGDRGNPVTQAQVRDWLAGAEVPAALTAAAMDDANRMVAWEYVLGLESLRRGPDAMRFGHGTWLPDDESRRFAATLGVDLDATIPEAVRLIPGLPAWLRKARERLIH
jgi:hypothetical protein